MLHRSPCAFLFCSVTAVLSSSYLRIRKQVTDKRCLQNYCNITKDKPQDIFFISHFILFYHTPNSVRAFFAVSAFTFPASVLLKFNAKKNRTNFLPRRPCFSLLFQYHFFPIFKKLDCNFFGILLILGNLFLQLRYRTILFLSTYFTGAFLFSFNIGCCLTDCLP